MEVEEPSETVVQIQRDGPTDREVIAKYRTVDGTASGQFNDFDVIAADQVVFGMGEELKSVTVRINDDEVSEGRETFYLEVYEIIG